MNLSVDTASSWPVLKLTYDAKAGDKLNIKAVQADGSTITGLRTLTEDEVRARAISLKFNEPLKPGLNIITVSINGNESSVGVDVKSEGNYAVISFANFTGTAPDAPAKPRFTVTKSGSTWNVLDRGAIALSKFTTLTLANATAAKLKEVAG